MDQLLRQILTELRGAWRFRWLAMAAAWLVAIGGILYVLSMPDQYEARAEVYVDTNDPLLATQRGGGGNDAQSKVDYVRRLLLSTPNLEQVARDTDLDLRAPTPQAFVALVQGLQEKITVAPARAGCGFDANLYQIVYRDPERRVAERVVQVLLNSFQQQSLEGDLRDDLQALEFLDQQMAEYRRRLEEAENRVAEFRRRNAGLIGTEGGFFTRLEGFKEQLRETRADLRIAQEKRAALAAQFRDSEAGAADGVGATSLAELENQILQTERQLDELRLVYTDEHPSVISARETLAALESRLERRREELGPLLGAAGGTGAVVENVRIALTQAEIEVTELRGRERDLEQRIAELQERVEIAPQLEAELAGLNRDHAVLRSQYESLLERREL
jgi:polysaccharide chain length determinant protein (PEP-CTERM system associated)